MGDFNRVERQHVRVQLIQFLKHVRGRFFNTDAGQAEGEVHPGLLFTSKEELSGDVMLDGNSAQSVYEIGRSDLSIKILKEVRKVSKRIIALNFREKNSVCSGT